MARRQPAAKTVGAVAARRIANVIGLVLALGIFFVGLELLGASFKLLGRDVASTLIRTTSNPFVGLFVGILATSVIQSSSTVTSIVVSIVAGGGLTVAGAIPIVMGANIGTSVTNTIVSLGHVTRRDEFRSAMSGAAVHDIFNLLTVVILLPLELAFGILSEPAQWLAVGLSDVGGTRLLSPIHLVVGPVAHSIVRLAGSNGWVVLATGGAVLFLALRLLVRMLRAITADTSERAIHTYLLADAPRAFVLGLLVTMMVQSSSVTTSVVVPLVAAGVYSVAQIFPFVVGANVGTTLTALLAALALASAGGPAGEAALEVGFAHLCFNLFGAGLFLPFETMRQIPVRLAVSLGRAVSRNRLIALAYVGGIFFLVPLLVIGLTRWTDSGRIDPGERTKIVSPSPSDSTAIPASPSASEPER